MILNDEEIMKTKTPIAIRPFKNVKISPNSSVSQWDKEIAKARLKKVVEWADAPCECVPNGGRLGKQCPECWQSILKEVE